MKLRKIFSSLVIAGLLAIPVVGSATQQSGTTTEDPIIQITSIKAKSVSIDKKFKKCIAEASKKEQPAPPVDPRVKCVGKVLVTAQAKAMAKCPDGSAKASASASIRQWVTVKAKSQAIASGEAEAKAKTIIRDRVKAKAKASVKCVKLVVTTDEKPVPPKPQKPTREVQVVQESQILEGKVSELPDTGPETAAMAGLGSGALGVGVRAYLRSRKSLLATLLDQ